MSWLPELFETDMAARIIARDGALGERIQKLERTAGQAGPPEPPDPPPETGVVPGTAGGTVTCTVGASGFSGSVNGTHAFGVVPKAIATVSSTGIVCVPIITGKTANSISIAVVRVLGTDTGSVQVDWLAWTPFGAEVVLA